MKKNHYSQGQTHPPHKVLKGGIKKNDVESDRSTTTRSQRKEADGSGTTSHKGSMTLTRSASGSETKRTLERTETGKQLKRSSSISQKAIKMFQKSRSKSVGCTELAFGDEFVRHDTTSDEEDSKYIGTSVLSAALIPQLFQYKQYQYNECCTSHFAKMRVLQHCASSGIELSGITPAILLRANGIRMRGFVATQPLNRHHIALRFPLSASINRSTIHHLVHRGWAQSNAPLRHILSRPPDHDADVLLLSLFLFQMDREPTQIGVDMYDEFYIPYLLSLSSAMRQGEDASPLNNYTKSEIELLRGTSLQIRADHCRRRMLETIEGNNCTPLLDDLEHIYSVVNSRVFGDGSSAFLYPIADFFNHAWPPIDSPSYIYTIENHVSDCFIVDRDKQAGEEVTLSYFASPGKSSHEYLMEKYGFVDTDETDFIRFYVEDIAKETVREELQKVILDMQKSTMRPVASLRLLMRGVDSDLSTHLSKSTREEQQQTLKRVHHVLHHQLEEMKKVDWNVKDTPNKRMALKASKIQHNIIIRTMEELKRHSSKM
ncbi:hypothetical protein PROFUN_13379 [Planoprotostelium fungivorum]|uniref:SET domain-containing protein n=1 Tax=Planoprotostelium fungivorum TaxID=1890364 RepID=A0A2P6MZT8_9EUKA|nr:hypothetical protein PROFUN_13379 [Planoprotostelium fungivorum]